MKLQKINHIKTYHLISIKEMEPKTAHKDLQIFPLRQITDSIFVNSKKGMEIHSKT